MFKVNVDGSFNYHTQRTGAGWIIRDDDGSYYLAGTSQLQQASTPLEAEGIALLHALQSSWYRGYMRLIMEGDCKTLFDILHGNITFASMEHLITDIRSWADRFTEISFLLTPRDSNRIADRLAKSAHDQTVTSQTFLYPPLCI